MPEPGLAEHPPAQTTISAQGVDWIDLLSGPILAVGAIAAYSRTLSVPLLFDDVATIAHNRSIQHITTALAPAFNTTAGGRPVLNLSLAINYAASGTETWSYHLLNLIIHILAGLTLLGILRHTFSRYAAPSAALAALCATLMWTLHPLQTESVTYIIQRAESLMGLFYLLTLYCFIRGADAGGRNKAIWVILSIISCLLGMATKEVMVSAPLMVLLYDRTFLAGNFRDALRRHKAAYAGLCTTWVILPFLVFSTHGRGGTSGFGVGVPWTQYALTQFPAVVRYLKLALWPHPLVFDYGTQWATDSWASLPSALVVIGLIAATAWALSRQGIGMKSLGLAGAWLFSILAPTSLIPGNRQTAAEHRMYLALIPVVVLGVSLVFRKLGRAALPCCFALSVGLGGMTFVRNETYRSAPALWSDTVAKCPENAFAHNNLGCELEALPGRRMEAIAQYEEALRLRPDDAEEHNNLGSALEKMPGRFDDALVQFNEALRLKPEFAEAHYNLACALETVPSRRDEAIAHFRTSQVLKPDFPEAHTNLGYVLEQMPGRLNDAIAEYEAALRLTPDDALAHYNLGNALAKIPGRSHEAISQYQAALRLRPNYTEARNNLGNTLSNLGRPTEAIAQYEETLRLNPKDAQAHYDLGVALYASGRRKEAIGQYEEALVLRPAYPEAHDNLGIALNAEGRQAEAISHYEEALRLDPSDEKTHYNLANALSLAGQTMQAIAQYEEALRLRPDDAEAHNNLGYALEKTPGRLSDAIAHYEEALRLKPDYAEAHNSLAYALEKMSGRLDEAILHYEEALRLKPDYAEAHFNLGNVMSVRGRTAEAIAQYEAALRLAPDEPAIHLNLALALLKVPFRTEEAIRHIEAILRLQPDNAQVRQLLDRVRASQ